MSYNVQLLKLLENGPHHISPFMLILFGMVRDMSAHNPNFVAVEIGVSCGNSTISLVTGLASTDHGRLHSCDIEPCEDAANYVYRSGCRDFWSFYQEDSLAFAKRFSDDSVNFVFLDSSHEYKQTKAEIEAWTPKLYPGGRMVFHDTCSRPEGVSKPIAEFLQANPWAYFNIDVDCGLGVLTKPKTP